MFYSDDETLRVPVQDSEFEPEERPRYWCTDCRAFRFTRRDIDGYPICRVCSPTTGE